MPCGISFHSYCKRASNSTKLVGCPISCSKLAQICWICNKSGNRAGWGRVEIWLTQSCKIIALCLGKYCPGDKWLLGALPLVATQVAENMTCTSELSWCRGSIKGVTMSTAGHGKCNTLKEACK
ncbi:hypothetical protein TNCV_2104781 [Trichonephila clavipes]|nr:hypothetical protein TNCV_2104781 [Trichonephila clavipes]